jgi:hypothetical protein
MLNEYKQESLRDLITKSRKTTNISSMMNKALNEIKKELVSTDKNVKVHAIQKLIFFYIHHYDTKWACFHTLEILATCGAPGKRYGYLIGQLQYRNNPDYLMLIPQMIRKDLMSQNLNFINSALNFFIHVVEMTIAKELTPDLEKLFNINNHLLRKKLIIALTKASENFLEADLGRYWDDLIIKFISILNGKELTNGIAICIISSIQKICSKYPDRCITVFVELMNYFTKCEINWNLIKIVDIFGMLFTYEKKFTKKKEFIKIISEQLSKTKSKSVEVQLVKLVISNFDVSTNPTASELFQNCEERLKNLLFFNDNNLVIISLRILKDLFKINKLLSQNYLNDILKILDSQANTEGNKSIQTECLEILNLCVSKENYKNIVEHLFEIRTQVGGKVIQTILDICTMDTYSRLSTKENFIWFLDILFSLGKSEFGKETELKISFIMRDIAQRIEILREIISDKSFELLTNLIQSVDEQNKDSNNQKKKIQFIGESDFFTENLRLKSPDTLITVLTFIIGEYNKNENENLQKRLSTLIQFISSNRRAKENYFIPITNCLIKLLLRLRSVSKYESIGEYLEKLEKLIDYQNNFSELDILEMNAFIKILVKLLRDDTTLNKNIYDTGKFFDIQLLPTHEQAQSMVQAHKDISLCFPLNEEELNFNKKSYESLHIQTSNSQILINNQQNIGSTSQNSKIVDENKDIIIDKKIYSPQA